MREALFIKRNRDKWIKYQRDQNNEPDEQAERFISLLDDLAYSRTFYPRSAVTRWINGIVATIYQQIYKNKKEKRSRLLSFWRTELPLLVYRHRKVFLFTLLFFTGCIAMGVFASAKNDFLIKTVLGENYVAMTEENIAKGDPFGVYRDSDQFTMFIRIAANNIRVAMLAFISGIAFGLGTLYILFSNGLMIGCFEYLFFAKGLGWQSIMVIWIHGTIEISSIVIAGAAGFILGNGLLFPGTYSRLQSFRRAAADAMKLVLALVPFFIAAAFLETYVTHLMSSTFSTTEAPAMPVWAGACILAASLLLMGWYFGWYPYRVHQRLQATQPPTPTPSNNEVMTWGA